MQQRTQTHPSVRINTAYISHGGGPLPLLEMQSVGEARMSAYHIEMIEALKALSTDLPKPDAVIAISAHWEDTEVCVTTHPEPSLIYDYWLP